MLDYLHNNETRRIDDEIKRVKYELDTIAREDERAKQRVKDAERALDKTHLELTEVARRREKATQRLGTLEEEKRKALERLTQDISRNRGKSYY